jgi:antitoxin MazE6
VWVVSRGSDEQSVEPKLKAFFLRKPDRSQIVRCNPSRLVQFMDRGYTDGMKTAISIPDSVFDDAERLVARFQTSRSELYARALAEFIARHDEEHVTQALDQVADSLTSDESESRAAKTMARAVLRQVEW